MVSVCRGSGNKDKFYPSIRNWHFFYQVSFLYELPWCSGYHICFTLRKPGFNSLQRNFSFFFPIFWKKILYFEKRPMFVALWSLSVKSGKDETLEIKNLMYEFTPVVEFESVHPCGHLEIFLFLLNRIVIKVQISHFQNMFFGLLKPLTYFLPILIIKLSLNLHWISIWDKYNFSLVAT